MTFRKELDCPVDFSNFFFFLFLEFIYDSFSVLYEILFIVFSEHHAKFSGPDPDFACLLWFYNNLISFKFTPH